MTALITPQTARALQDPRHYPQHGSLAGLLAATADDMQDSSLWIPGNGAKDALIATLKAAAGSDSIERQARAFRMLGDAYRDSHIYGVNGGEVIPENPVQRPAFGADPIGRGFLDSAYCPRELPNMCVDFDSGISFGGDLSGIVGVGHRSAMANRSSQLRTDYDAVANALGYTPAVTEGMSWTHEFATMAMILSFAMYASAEFGYVAVFHTNSEEVTPTERTRQLAERIHPFYVGPHKGRLTKIKEKKSSLVADPSEEALAMFKSEPRDPFELLYASVASYARELEFELKARTRPLQNTSLTP